MVTKVSLKQLEQAQTEIRKKMINKFLNLLKIWTKEHQLKINNP